MKPGGLKRKALIFPPLMVGIAILVWFVRSGGEPVQTPPEEISRPVRVIAAPAVDYVPRTLGYGHVQPGRTWEAVAEVGGRIIEKHERLESGELMAAGEAILRIDPTDYQLALDSTGARIRGAEAQIAELNVREENTRSSLEIEQRGLALAQKDLERKRTLLKRGSISAADVDQSERTVLSLRQAVQGQQNALALIPSEREVLQANLSLYQSERRQAERDLERTQIVTPFNGRVAAVNVEERQFAAAGHVMAVIDGVDTAEIAAQISIDRVRGLFAGTHFDAQDIAIEDIGEVFGKMGLTAAVRLNSGEMEVSWPARFTRIRESVDPSTRTIGVVVTVDGPYRMAEAGRRPPLAKNMFVEVELRGKAVPGRIVIPRSALHDGMVYVVGAEMRLERRLVTVGARQSNFVTVDSGLAAGETVVVSDLSPAIDGMLLTPVEDAGLLARVVASATGQGALR